MDECDIKNQCVYLNVRSLCKNYVDTQIMIRNKTPKIIFMSETRLIEETDNKEVNIKSYKLIRCDSYTSLLEELRRM